MQVNHGWVLGVCDPVDCDYSFTISLFSTQLYSIFIYFLAFLMHYYGNEHPPYPCKVVLKL